MTHSTDVLKFYESSAEELRLRSGLPQLEAVRTRQLVTRHAPSAPATVLDIGGGAGEYAFWLADQGYNVHLLDPAAPLVKAAAERNAVAQKSLASCGVADARALPFADSSADVTLFLGPLYHLTEAADRARALSEAARVLRPGGIFFAAAISRWASALYGLSRNLFNQPGFGEIVARTIRDGQNRNPNRLTGAFTTAYFHRPEELRAEVTQAGFQVLEIQGLEGAACLFSDFDERWRDPEQQRTLIQLADALGTEPALLGVSAHLLAIARKPCNDEAQA